MQHETVIVLDFGGQYNQLIARRVRENNVYCEIYSYKTDLSVIKAKNPKGIIFTGGPNSVYLEDSPTIDPEIFNWGIPVSAAPLSVSTARPRSLWTTAARCSRMFSPLPSAG